jgi:PAS domain S-box-containing protein
LPSGGSKGDLLAGDRVSQGGDRDDRDRCGGSAIELAAGPTGSPTAAWAAAPLSLSASDSVMAPPEAAVRDAIDDAAYRALFDISPQPMWVYDRDNLRFLAVNDASLRLYGYAREVFLALRLPDIRPASALEQLERDLDEAGEGVDRYPARIHQRSNGELIEVEGQCIQLSFAGRPARLVVVEDITERRRAEQALRDSELRFRLAASFGQVWDWDIVRGAPHFPAPFWHSLGMEPPEPAAVRATLEALMPDDDRAHWLAALHAHLRDRVPYRLEIRVRDAQQRVRWFQTQGQAVWDARGQAIYMAGTSFEITRRRVFEEALRASESRLNHLLRSAPTVIYSARTGPERAKTYVSPNVEHHLGWKPEAFTDDAGFWCEHVHEDDRETVMADLASVGADEQTVEYRFRHADGRWRWLQDTRRLVPAEAGQPAEVIGSWIDITERRLAEVRLRESEQRFRVAASFGQVWEWDIVAGQVHYTPEFWRGLGFEPPLPENSVAALEALSPPRDRAIRQAALLAHLRDGKPYQRQTPRLDSCGRLRWFQTFGQAVRDAHGRAVAMIGTIFEITEQRQAQDALRASEQTLRHFFDSGMVGMAMSTDDKHWGQFNARLQAMLGYDAERMRQLTWAEMTHPDDLAADLQAFERVRTGQCDSYRLDKRFLRGDGTVLEAAMVVHCRRDDAGDAVNYFVILEDIGARKQTEALLARQRDDLERRVQLRSAELQRSESRLRTIFDTVPVAICEEDWSEVQRLLLDVRAQGVVDVAAHLAAHPELVRACLRAVHVRQRNRQATALYEQLAGAYPLFDLQASQRGARDPGPFVDELVALWNGQRQFSAKQVLHVQPAGASEGQGQDVSLMMTVALPTLDDADGMALICMADISEIDRLNAELDRSVAKLRQANLELETFTYSVSHDLKAPLRGIDGYSRLLMSEHKSRLDEEGHLFLSNIRQATQHMGALIDDLLTYSRLERRNQTLAQIELAGFVADVLAPVRTELTSRPGPAVDLVVQVPAGLCAHGDVQGLTLSLRNLVDNGLKFSRGQAAPRVVVSATRVEDGVRLQVQDNGVGFDMKFHDRIFAIFQRLHRAEDYPGTGVGLAIVHKAMDRMGGRAWADSQPGQGATFYLELPESA